MTPVWQTYQDLYKTVFHPLIINIDDRDFARLCEERNYISIDKIIDRISDHDRDILDKVSCRASLTLGGLARRLMVQVAERIYDRLDLLSQRKLEPHNQNHNPRFDFMEELRANAEIWER